MAGTCENCGTSFTFFGNSSNAGNGLCVKCDGERYQRAIVEEKARLAKTDPYYAAEKAVQDAVAAMLVTTEAIMPDIDIVERHGVVGSDVAFGAGVLKDLAVGLSNTFGGRSGTMRKLMGDTRSLALAELKHEAHLLGANAVIGVAFTVTSIGHAGGSMTLMCATGTAATVRRRA